MGISLSMIERMQELGVFGRSGMSVLDIGSSNLYSASAERVLRFLERFGVSATPEVVEFAARLEKGSSYDPVHGGLNEAFAGELFERAGMRYAAIDIADGYRTEIVDLNHSAAPPLFVDAFDLVLNFGTTEHLLNQYNAFKVMHDCTRVGGFIVHSLPGVGYFNHGYFTYTPRCFFDLAGYNQYELVRFWFDGPAGSNDLFAPVRDYQPYFPALASTLAERDSTENGRKAASLDLPDIGLVVVLRKVRAAPFVGSLERSTSVGDVPNAVTTRREPEAIPELTDKTECRLRDRLLEGTASRDEGLQLYTLMTGRGASFPLAWEERVLGICIAAEPHRMDLLTRLREVLLTQGKHVPHDIERAFAQQAAKTSVREIRD
jgi:hypothetical protein